MKPAIIHHKDADGWCSAAIVSKHVSNAKFIGMSTSDYGTTPKIDDDITHLFIVDFSFPKEVMVSFIDRFEEVVWIDHHKTAIDAIGDTHVPGLRDCKTAACMLTWRWFNQETEPPESVKYIADYDTWTFKYGDTTRHFQAGLSVEESIGDPTSTTWIELLDKRRNDYQEVLNNGRAIYKYQKGMVKSLLNGGDISQFGGFRAFVINIPTNITSLAGEMVRERKLDVDFMLAWHCSADKDETWKMTCSLRATKPGFDVSAIAKRFGGGGHPGAAGFVKKISLPLKRVV